MNTIPSIVALMEKKSVTSSMLVSLYSGLYNGVIRKEIKLAGINSKDRVLNVGCGAIPFTAIKVAKLTGARVWAIDRDDKAVAAACECISTVGMQDLIQVAKLEGCEPVPFGFDVALVALQVAPKKDVLLNLVECCEPGGRLIFRKPRKRLKHHYDFLPADPAPLKNVRQNQLTFESSVMYEVSL